MKKKAIVEYETSDGLKTVEFISENDIANYADSNANILFIDERKKDELIKELATINLQSFVSFRIEEIKD